MDYIRPFCKIITGFGSGSGVVTFTDTSGQQIYCNYIEFGMASPITVDPQDIFEIEPIGIGGAQGHLDFSGLTVSGGLGTVSTNIKPGIIIIPQGQYATSINFYRTRGTASRTLYVNYGVLKQERNPLKSQSKYKGV